MLRDLTRLLSKSHNNFFFFPRARYENISPLSSPRHPCQQWHYLSLNFSQPNNYNRISHWTLTYLSLTIMYLHSFLKIFLSHFDFPFYEWSVHIFCSFFFHLGCLSFILWVFLCVYYGYLTPHLYYNFFPTCICFTISCQEISGTVLIDKSGGGEFHSTDRVKYSWCIKSSF